MRGDRPIVLATSVVNQTFTPHARGSTLGVSNHAVCLRVYPACAGIDLRDHLTARSTMSLPRMRGDRPWQEAFLSVVMEFTPHARGSTLQKKLALWCKPVYPHARGSTGNTPARRSLIKVYPAWRIDLLPFVVHLACVSLPRMRGIDRIYLTSLLLLLCLPRMRDRPSFPF